jgi:hypothetical protein
MCQVLVDLMIGRHFPLCAQTSEQAKLARHLDAEVFVREPGGNASARGAVEEADL